jgi:hypothetical protein
VDPKHNDPAGRKWKSTVPWPAAQLFDSDSDDFKIDGSDGAACDIGAESDDNLEESDDDSILGLIGDKLKATLDYEVCGIVLDDFTSEFLNYSHSGLNLLHAMMVCDILLLLILSNTLM